MTAQPLVSIIIPCYNAQRFLKETLESAAAQTVSSSEIIVVDDGSTDGTAEILRLWRSKIRLEITSNRGVSAARNTGTALATGTYLQYLDADDLLMPDAIEQRIHVMELQQVDVVYSDYELLEETSDGRFHEGAVVSRRMEQVHSDPAISWLTDFWVPPAALLYRKTLVDRMTGWNESLPVIQDARFGLDAALMGGRFAHCPGVGAQYRVVKNFSSLSRRDPAAFARDVFRNACQIEDLWKNGGELSSEKKKVLGRIYDYTARTFLLRDYAVFQENIDRLYAVDPGFKPTWPKVSSALAKALGPQAAQRVMGLLSSSSRERTHA